MYAAAMFRNQKIRSLVNRCIHLKNQIQHGLVGLRGEPANGEERVCILLLGPLSKTGLSSVMVKGTFAGNN